MATILRKKIAKLFAGGELILEDWLSMYFCIAKALNQIVPL
jgi:hypothetical protein